MTTPIGKPFHATARHQPGVGIIDLAGDMLNANEPTLDAAYTEATQHNPATLLLNFSQVDYLNSGGIALVVTLLKRAHQSKQRILACNLNVYFTELFEITQLTEFMQLYLDEATALAHI
jgi:anti-sigma B factor antagonist